MFQTTRELQVANERLTEELRQALHLADTVKMSCTLIAGERTEAAYNLFAIQGEHALQTAELARLRRLEAGLSKVISTLDAPLRVALCKALGVIGDDRGETEIAGKFETGDHFVEVSPGKYTLRVIAAGGGPGVTVPKDEFGVGGLTQGLNKTFYEMKDCNGPNGNKMFNDSKE